MFAELSLLNRVVDILSDAPSADTIMSIQPTKNEKERFDFLLTKNEEGTLSSGEKDELETFLFADHLVGMAKAKAYKRASNRTVA